MKFAMGTELGLRVETRIENFDGIQHTARSSLLLLVVLLLTSAASSQNENDIPRRMRGGGPYDGGAVGRAR